MGSERQAGRAHGNGKIMGYQDMVRIGKHGALTLTLIAAIACGRNCFAQSSYLRGDREALRAVVTQMSNNLQQITTWRGDVTISVQSSGQDTQRQKETSVSFLYDASALAERSLLTTNKNIFTKDGNTTSIPAVFNNGLVVNDTYAHMEEPVVRTDKGPRQLVLLPKGKARPELRSDHFSPMWYMRSAGQNILEKMQMVLDSADVERKHKDRYWQVSKAGSLVTLEYMYGGKLQDRWVFDLEQGANMVEFWGDDGVTMEHYRYKYTKDAGAWVPAALEYAYESRNSRSPLRTESRHMEWTNQVNGSVDPKEFSWEAIGVKPGDLVSDAIAGVSYIYQAEQAGIADSAMRDIDRLALSAATQPAGGEKGPATRPATQPVAAAPMPAAAGPVRPDRPGLPYLAIGVIGAAAVALILVAWQARNRRRAGK